MARSIVDIEQEGRPGSYDVIDANTWVSDIVQDWTEDNYDFLPAVDHEDTVAVRIVQRLIEVGWRPTVGND